MLTDPDDEKMPSNEVSLTQLRKNIYQMVDQVIETGKPLTINRQGSLLRLAVVSKASTKLGNLKKRNTIVNEGDELEDIELKQWEPDNGFN